MARRTPEQKIAELQSKLARAKEQERKERTRRLIRAGVMFEPVARIVQKLPVEQQAEAMLQVLDAAGMAAEGIVEQMKKKNGGG